MKEFDVMQVVKPQAEDVISVSQLNKMAKAALENHLPIMWIKGEISGFKAYAHWYFDLKDEGAKISCVVFAKLATLIDFPLENGLQVEVRGRVSIYPQNGSYQINVERVRKVGLGELWEAYARLINKLRSEGLFESKFKKVIPTFPRSIGVITSKEGSVIRDVVATLKRRMANIPIIIYHSAVQGTDASMQLVRAIRTANQRQEVDVLIVCRGGGSMQDLWCFNEEAVAREVFLSHIPLISAVGHETDTTIIDFVADLRAPTPTAAAELVAKSRQEWISLVERLEFNLVTQLTMRLNFYQQRLDLAQANLKSLNPLNKILAQQQTVIQLQHKLRTALNNYLAKLAWKLDVYQAKFKNLKVEVKPYQAEVMQLQARLQRGMAQLCKGRQIQLNSLLQSLNLINPQNVLTRGYAIISDNKGRIIQSIAATKHHARVNITLADGSVSAIVDQQFNTKQAELI